MRNNSTKVLEEAYEQVKEARIDPTGIDSALASRMNLPPYAPKGYDRSRGDYLSPEMQKGIPDLGGNIPPMIEASATDIAANLQPGNVVIILPDASLVKGIDSAILSYGHLMQVTQSVHKGLPDLSTRPSL